MFSQVYRFDFRKDVQKLKSHQSLDLASEATIILTTIFDTLYKVNSKSFISQRESDFQGMMEAHSIGFYYYHPQSSTIPQWYN